MPWCAIRTAAWRLSTSRAAPPAAFFITALRSSSRRSIAPGGCDGPSPAPLGACSFSHHADDASTLTRSSPLLACAASASSGALPAAAGSAFGAASAAASAFASPFASAILVAMCGRKWPA
jgi:hypothetical protein